MGQQFLGQQVQGSDAHSAADQESLFAAGARVEAVAQAGEQFEALARLHRRHLVCAGAHNLVQERKMPGQAGGLQGGDVADGNRPSQITSRERHLHELSAARYGGGVPLQLQQEGARRHFLLRDNRKQGFMQASHRRFCFYAHSTNNSP